MSANAPDMKAAAGKTFPVARLRADFPALDQQVHGHPLAYLDNAATAQKPHAVIDAVRSYYEHDNANIHRGVHTLSERATAAYEGAREKTRAFLNARSTREIVFLRGATEAINLVAASLGQSFGPGDEILITGLEHHSNIVPWQMLAQRSGARLVVAPIDERGVVTVDAVQERLNENTRLLAIGHVSNALGTVNPLAQLIPLARAADAKVLVDGAQAAPHMSIDVQALDCDFYAISGHKMFAPTGIGALYGREALLDAMPPWQGGGDMIRMVTFDRTEYNELPFKFEAGTPNIAGGIGLGAAIDYLHGVGLDGIAAYEAELLAYATAQLESIPGLRIIGTAPEKASVISFVMEGIHPHDLGTILDQHGVAIRTGHHCAMPVMDFFGIPATARASLAFYNTRTDVDALVAALGKAQEFFA